MRLVGLLWAGLWRKPARTTLTIVCIAVAFLLFGLLQGINSAFLLILEHRRLDRLFVDPRFGRPLPLAYGKQIANVPGVTQVTQVAFIRGYYQDPKNSVFAIATHPEIWLTIRPEIRVPKEQIEAVKRIRTGVLVSDWLARKNGWSIGDKFTLQTRVPTVQGGSDWTFEIVGILQNTESVADTSILLANFAYYDEFHAGEKGTTDRYLLRIDDPRRTSKVSEHIDQLFANSSVPTTTQSEHQNIESDIANMSDLSFFARAIMGAVFFTLLLLTTNSMTESIRERTAEFAVLKALGFSDRRVFAIIAAEAMLLCTGAALVGLVLAAAAFPLAKSYVGTALLPPVVIGLGLAIAVGVGLVSAAAPAWRVTRMNVIDALAGR